MFCDITLRTNGRSYSAHRAVLAAVSDHFQEIFTEMDSSMKADIDLTGKTRYLEVKMTVIQSSVSGSGVDLDLVRVCLAAQTTIQFGKLKF